MFAHLQPEARINDKTYQQGQTRRSRYATSGIQEHILAHNKYLLSSYQHSLCSMALLFDLCILRLHTTCQKIPDSFSCSSTPARSVFMVRNNA